MNGALTAAIVSFLEAEREWVEFSATMGNNPDHEAQLRLWGLQSQMQARSNAVARITIEQAKRGMIDGIPKRFHTTMVYGGSHERK